MRNARRWACGVLTAAVVGTGAGADPVGDAPPPAEVTALPVIFIPAPDVSELPDASVLPAAGVQPKAQPRALPPASDVVGPPDVPQLNPMPDVPAPPPAAVVAAAPEAPAAPTPPTVPGPAEPPAPPEVPPTVLPPVIVPPPIPGPEVAPAPGGWYAGGGLMFLTPYLSNNTAYTVVTPPVPAGPVGIPVAVGSAQSVPINWDYGQAWEAWVGWTHPCGWGVRAGTFVFNQGSGVDILVNQPDPIAPRIVTVPPVIPFIPGAAAFGAPTAVLAGAGIGADRLLFVSDLNIRSADLEGKYQFAGEDYLVRVSAGGRWVGLRQGYHAAIRNPGDGITTEAQGLDYVQEFSGAGPTVGLFLRHQIATTGLAAYAGVRGAILAGHLDQHATFTQDITDPTLAAFVGTQQTRTRFDNRADHVLTFGEVELGLEYAVAVGGSRLFLRGGVVGQSYGNAGNATTSLGTIALIGGQAAVGLNY